MEGLRVSLFGKFCIQFSGQVLANVDGRKTQELFSYLLLYREEPHFRENLANLLWSNVPTAKSKGYLRKTLWQLQTALGGEVLPLDNNILVVEPEWVQINAKVALWLDVAVLEQAFALVHGVPGQTLERHTMEKVRRATAVYQGDLLEGWYQEWCLYERERFQRMYLIMLDKLMNYCEAHGKYEDGLVYGTRILHYDQARERTHRSLMRLYYLGGYRTEALRQYLRCVTILKKELGVQPSRRSKALYEQIRADRFVTSNLVMRKRPPISGTTPPLNEVLESLEQLQVELTAIQHQVQQKIKIVKKLLNP